MSEIAKAITVERIVERNATLNVRMIPARTVSF
jgi:hypothetical protein